MNYTADTVMMVRPKHFGFNPETAGSNVFQHQSEFSDAQILLSKVLLEFDAMVKGLEAAGINVFVVEDLDELVCHDSIFPNNWFTAHQDGSLILYPMLAENRRLERREDILQLLEKNYHFSKLYDFSFYEEEDMYLEGTGSMVLDRKNKVVYASLSPRTNIHVLDKFCILKSFDSVYFHSVDRDGRLIYHTNVMMSLGEKYAMVCLESIPDETERENLLNYLGRSNKEIIDITLEQVYAFCGNCLQLKSRSGKYYLVFSKTAYDHLNEDKISRLMAHGELLIFDIPTIERVGGGSVRCMLAELFIPN